MKIKEEVARVGARSNPQFGSFTGSGCGSTRKLDGICRVAIVRTVELSGELSPQVSVSNNELRRKLERRRAKAVYEHRRSEQSKALELLEGSTAVG